MAAFGTDLAWDGEDLHVTGRPLRVPGGPIEAGNSGTTLRLLAGVSSLVDGVTTLRGDSSLQRRPMGPLLGALNSLGAQTKSLGEDGRPPVEIRGVLRGGAAKLPGDVSSQFLSSLLVACPLAKEESEVHVSPPIRSEPYIDMTRDLVQRFGAAIGVEDGTYRIAGDQEYRETDVDVPGDFSSAALPLVAAAITDGDVTVTDLGADGSQGDRRILDLLRSFGATVDVADDRVRVRAGRLTARAVDIGDVPDLFPILAVLASQADGETRFTNGGHLRFKESDRIASTAAMLRALGVAVQTTEDGCLVSGPRRLLGGSVDARGDHRILMAAAVAGLASQRSVDITDPWCFRASYPSFLDDFRALGALHAVVA